jgi:hypothetical protein
MADSSEPRRTEQSSIQCWRHLCLWTETAVLPSCKGTHSMTNSQALLLLPETKRNPLCDQLMSNWFDKPIPFPPGAAAHNFVLQPWPCISMTSLRSRPCLLVVGHQTSGRSGPEAHTYCTFASAITKGIFSSHERRLQLGQLITLCIAKYAFL